MICSSHVVTAASSSEGGLLSLPQHGDPAPADCSMNFSNVSYSHRLQFFINCTSVGPSHRVQSFRNRFQRGFPVGSQVLPGACFSTGFPWGHSLPEASTCSSMGVSASGPLLHLGLPWAAEVQPCLTVVFMTGRRGISAPAPGAPPALPSLLAWVSAGLFLSHTLTPLFSGCNLLLCNNFPSQIQDPRGATTTPDRH